MNEAELLKWINRRKAPKNRQFVEKILSAIDDSDNPMKYVDVSHALSLNDAYWITNDIMDYKWDEFNLYSHPFDEAFFPHSSTFFFFPEKHKELWLLVLRIKIHGESNNFRF